LDNSINSSIGRESGMLGIINRLLRNNSRGNEENNSLNNNNTSSESGLGLSGLRSLPYLSGRRARRASRHDNNIDSKF
jgi:hypothetical protein